MKKQYSTLTMLVLASLFSMSISGPPALAETTAGITVGKIDPADTTKVTTEKTLQPGDDIPDPLYGTDYTKQTSYNALSVTSMTNDTTSLGMFTAAGYLNAAATSSGTAATGANNNTVTITNTDVKEIESSEDNSSEYGSIYGGYVTGSTQDTPLSANGNTVTITDGRKDDVYLGSVVGGYTDAGEASGNTVQLTGVYIPEVKVTVDDKESYNYGYNNIYVEEGDYDYFVAGGQTNSGSANSNEVTLTSSTVTNSVIGGRSMGTKAEANSNRVTATDLTTVSVYGGQVIPQPQLVQPSDESESESSVTAASASLALSGTANDNQVTLTNGTISSVYGGAIGGVSSGGSQVINTQYTLLAAANTASYDMLDVNLSSSDSSASEPAVPSFTLSEEADGNRVEVTNLTVNTSVYGGAANYGSSSSGITIVPTELALSADGNSVAIEKSTVKSNVYGGFVGVASSSGGSSSSAAYTLANADSLTTSLLAVETPSETVTVNLADLLENSSDSTAASIPATLSANNNQVTLTETAVAGSIYGGYINLGTTSSPTVNLPSNMVDTNSLLQASLAVADGSSQAAPATALGANNNRVHIVKSADASTVSASGLPSTTKYVFGGFANGGTETSPLSTNDNYVSIDNTTASSDASALYTGAAIGGYTTYGDASGNYVSLAGKVLPQTESEEGGTLSGPPFNLLVGSVYGGHAAYGKADQNTVTLVNTGVLLGLSTAYITGSASTADSSKLLGSGVVGGEATGSGSISASSNVVQISGSASYVTSVYGGLVVRPVNPLSATVTLEETTADTGAANSNQVLISDGTAMFVTGGSAVSQNSSSLEFTAQLTNATPADAAYTLSLEANGNQVALTNAEASTVLGGVASTVVFVDTTTYTGSDVLKASVTAKASASDNKVLLTNSTVDSVVGGYAQAQVAAESVDTNTLNLTTDAQETIAHNQVYLSGTTVGGDEEGELYGGVLGGVGVLGTAEGNQVILDQGSQTTTAIGGLSIAGTAQGNQVTLSSSTADSVYGGAALLERAAENTVNINSGNATRVYGGAAGNQAVQDGTAALPVMSTSNASSSEMPANPSLSVSKNTVNLYGGTVGSVWGGYAQDLTLATTAPTQTTTVTAADTLDASLLQDTGDQGTSELPTVTPISYTGGDANSNVVNYYGGTVTDSLTGGESQSGAASDNIVNLYAALVGENLNLYGGVSTKESTGNTLNVYSKGNSVANLDYFQNYNFYVPVDTVVGDKVLTVTGTANLANATVQAGVEDAMKLNEGQVVDLISGTSALQDTGATYAMMDGQDFVTDAGFVQRKVSIWKQDDNTVVIGIPKNTTPTLNQDTKLFSEDRTSTLNLVNNSSDFAATNAYDGALTAWNFDTAVKGDFTPYLVVGGHDLRADTGSYVDTYGLNANLGFVKRTYQKGYTDTLMPFLEYGNGNYTSHLDDGARGDGNQRYIGAGLLARRDLTSGIHYEALIHAGRTNGDFHGQIGKHFASYDTSAPYISAMVGAGKIIKKNTSSVDYYGKVFWTHLGSDSVQMHSDLGTSQYNFDSINSYRTRLGFRWTKDVSPTTSYYAGLAWNYEFGGDAQVCYGTFETPTAGVKGSSGLLELGWQSKIDKDHDWGADVRVTGWAGVQRGVTYSATVSRAF